MQTLPTPRHLPVDVLELPVDVLELRLVGHQLILQRSKVLTGVLQLLLDTLLCCMQG